MGLGGSVGKPQSGAAGLSRPLSPALQGPEGSRPFLCGWRTIPLRLGAGRTRGPGEGTQPVTAKLLNTLPTSQSERSLLARGSRLAFRGPALRGWSRDRARGTAGGPRRLAGSQGAFWSQQGCLPDPGRKRRTSHTLARWAPRGPGRPRPGWATPRSVSRPPLPCCLRRP